MLTAHHVSDSIAASLKYFSLKSLLSSRGNEEAKRLKHPDDENKRLKALVADQASDIQMLKHLSKGNW